MTAQSRDSSSGNSAPSIALQQRSIAASPLSKVIKGAHDRGRRFPLAENPAAVPFDVALKPGESINTSLTFLTDSAARQLFLTGEEKPLHPFLVKLLVSLYFGNDNSLMHKPTLLRVL